MSEANHDLGFRFIARTMRILALLRRSPLCAVRMSAACRIWSAVTDPFLSMRPARSGLMAEGGTWRPDLILPARNAAALASLPSTGQGRGSGG